MHIFLFLCFTVCQATEDFTILINRKVEHGGFHRYLSTEIITLTKLDPSPPTQPLIHSADCSLLVAENFDSNFYVDSYELKSEVYERSFSFILSNKVNTESAGYRARPFNLFLYLNRKIVECHESTELNFKNIAEMYLISDTENLKRFCRIFYRLPIHARYQSPVSAGDYVSFNLRPPNLFATNCTATKTQLGGVVPSPNDLKLLVNGADYPSRLVFPCRKGRVERRTDTLIIQFTNDYITKTFFDKNEVDVEESAVKAVDMCLWNKLDFKSVGVFC